MSGALQSPVYQLNPNSTHYKAMKKVKDMQPFINEAIKNIEDEYRFTPGDFVYYGSKSFGFYPYSASYQQYKNEMTVRPDRNGVHLFKKNSKTFKVISPWMEEIAKIHAQVSPFALHEIFGINNPGGQQWIGDEYFVSVRSQEEAERTFADPKRLEQYPEEPAIPVDYKKYLEKLTVALKEQEEKRNEQGF